MAKEKIGKFYQQIALFWNIPDIKMGIEVCRCFRCIVNAGVDPTLLRIDQPQWETDGLKLQILDKLFIQSILRDSGVLLSIVSKFLIVVESFVRESNLHRQGEVIHSTDDSPSHSSSNSARDVEGDSNSNSLNVEASNISKSLEFAQGMLELCSEIANEDGVSAGMMCAFRVCDGVISMLKDASRDGPRHRRIPLTINILWIAIESFVNQCKNHTPISDPDMNEEVQKLEYLDTPVPHGEGKEIDEEARMLESLAVYRLDACILDFEECISVLRDALVMFIHDGYRLVDKECRNEIVIVLTLIAEFPMAIPCFVSCGLITILLTYSTVGEMGKIAWPFFHKPLAKFRNFVTTFDVDLQFKRTLWLILSDLLRHDDPDMICCVASSPMLSTLFLYLEQNSIEPASRYPGAPSSSSQSSSSSSLASPTTSMEGMGALKGGNEGSMFFGSMDSSVDIRPSFIRGNSNGNGNGNGSISNSNIDFAPNVSSPSGLGSPGTPSKDAVHETFKEEPNHSFFSTFAMSQLREFQLLAVKFLAQNSTRMLAEMLRLDGPRRILRMIVRYCQSNNSDHKAIIHFSLLLLNRCILNSRMVRRILEEEQAIPVFIYLFTSFTEESIRSQAIRLISILCRGDVRNCQQQFRHHRGISALITILNLYSSVKKPQVGIKAGIKVSLKESMELEDPSNDELGDVPVLIVSVLDCLRLAVIGNKKSESRLAQEEGIDAILNILEISLPIMRIQILRLISDLLKNKKMLTFVHAWRSSKTLRSAAQLMAHSWLDEENRLSSLRHQGILNNVWDPLGNQDWPEDTINQTHQESLSSNSVVDQARSLAVSRLASAILAARTGVHSVVPADLKQAVLEKDLRCILANIFDCMGLFTNYDHPVSSSSSALTPSQSISGESAEKDGFDFTAHGGDDGQPLLGPEDDGDYGDEAPPVLGESDLGLSFADKQAIALAQRFKILREGEYWTSILEDLTVINVTPIEADNSLVESRMEVVFNATLDVQMEQMFLQDQEGLRKEDLEKAYIHQILTQKNQQFKAEWLRRNGKHKM